MNIEKLMEILKGTEEVVFRINGLGEEVYTTKEIHECIEPLYEKQVAKKPVWDGPHNEAKDDAIPYCSVCDAELEEDWNGCPYCLQKLDWSEE